MIFWKAGSLRCGSRYNQRVIAPSALVFAGVLRRRDQAAAIAGFCAFSAIALAAHAPSAALVAMTAAVTLLAGFLLPIRSGASAARDELQRAAAGVLAVGVAATIAFARIEAREAALWQEQPTRADRVREILAAAAERRATLVIAAASLGAMLILEGLRVRRVWRQAVVSRPSTSSSVLVAVLALAVISDVALHARFHETRDTLWKALEKPFALFARLDPPSGDALESARFPSHRAPSLQITRDVVAIDAEPVAPLAALDSEEGRMSVAAAVGRAVAHNAAEPQPGDRDLAVSIDREVPYRTVIAALRLAHRAGARNIEIRFTRGARPQIPVSISAPVEVGYVLPTDFVAVPAELATDGFTASADARFGDVAPAMLAAVRTDAPLRVGLGP